MKYNIYIRNYTGKFNILCVDEKQLEIIVDAYKKAKDRVSINGENYIVGNIHEIKIFVHDIAMSKENFIEYCKRKKEFVPYLTTSYIPPKYLNLYGDDVTSKIIGNIQYGEFQVEDTHNNPFINPNRLSELKQIKSKDFDLTKLIQLCEEINYNYEHENYLSVGMIGRTIINHIPPIFGCKTFNEVANNYGSNSFKKSMNHLNQSLKNIADGYLHQTIRKKESLPNNTQVDFSQSLDVLLEEIVRKLN